MIATAAAARGAAAARWCGALRPAAARIVSMIILGLFLGAAFSARAMEPARPLYLLDTTFVSPQDSAVYRVEPATGELTLVADLGPDNSPFYGLAAASETVLYATASDPSGSVCAQPGCLLLRIVLAPGSTTPAAVELIGPVLHDGQEVGKVTGLTFRNDDTLWAVGQDDDRLYVLDPASGAASLIGPVDVDVYGGDITFTDDDRLLLWTNAGPAAGLYELDPQTALASAIELTPYNGHAGMAALGHGQMLYASSPALDRLVEIDAVAGFTGQDSPLTLSGAPFDHSRGDLDSPRCLDDGECADADTCTVDVCAPGGCRNLSQPDCCTPVSAVDDTCDGVDDDCDGLVDDDLAASEEVCDGLDNDCNGVVDDLPPPAGLPVSTFVLASGETRLRWTPVSGATAYDVLRGDGQALLATHGDYSAAVDTCLADGLAGNHLTLDHVPPAGTYTWYLVRPESCGTPGSYETGQPSQKVTRGPGIAAAPGACP